VGDKGRRTKKKKALPPSGSSAFDKDPRAAAVPDAAAAGIVWRLARLDLDGEWGWRKLGAEQVERVLEQLKNFEGMTVGELFNRAGNKVIPATNICKEARDRLEEIQADDLDELWELRLTNKNRVWGSRTGHVYQVLWWDPDHTVCPAALRHT
jgi:hypothetical protein